VSPATAAPAPGATPPPATAGSQPDFDRVTVAKVTKVYGRHRALAGVSLELRAGSICGLLGANGAGKSTLLAILATLLRPTSGTVHYGAFPHATAARALRGALGFVAHDSFLYADLTARENLRLFGRLYGLTDPEGRARELIARVGLAAAQDRVVRTYSRGMQQRLALARAILHQPRLLLLDEPFTGLDRAAVEMLKGLLVEHQAAGTILLLVTHDLEIAAEVCDHYAILKGGKVAHEARYDAPLSYGALKDLYHGVVDG
jgi:heme exporter protein A